MYELIATHEFPDAGGTMSATVGSGHINGLFITGAVPIEGRTYSITAQLRTTKGTKVLLQDVSIVDLMKIQAQKNGVFGMSRQTLIDNLEYAIDAGTAGSGGAINLTEYTNSPLFAYQEPYKNEGGIHIDLGSIYFGRNEELVITIRGNGNDNNNGPHVRVLSYSDARDPYHLVRYERVQDESTVFHDCVEVYAFGPQGLSPKNQAAADISVRYGDQTKLSGYEDLLFAAQARSALPFGGIAQGVLCWQNPTEIPDTVEVRVTGSQSETFYFIGVSREFIRAKTSASNVETLNELRTRLEKLERTEPEKAKALRHAGVAPKAEEVAATVAVMETGEEDEK